MNENIDLTKILKNCPKETKFYSTLYGEVRVNVCNQDVEYPIILLKCISPKNNTVPVCTLTKTGKYNRQFDGECTLFPSKDQRDWSKFTAPWFKKERFDPKTLKAFYKVIVRYDDFKWKLDFFSHYEVALNHHYKCISDYYKYCIPYNDDTKHLVGTKDEAPEYYRYWED